MPPPPSKPRPSSIERGGGDAENDPELQKGTQAKIKVPTVARGGAAAGDDEEVQKGTQAQVKLPVSRGGRPAEDDPERMQGTQAKAKMPTRRPAKGGKQRPPSNWEAPPGKMSGEQKKGGEYKTGSEYNSLDEEDEASDYHTGNDYEALEGDSKELNLEGDGLDALDPDLGPPKTKGLDLLLAEAADEDAAGADDDNATRAGPPLSLEITAGPDQGKKKKLKGVRLVIGRTPGVDLQLSDQSVSRRHVELVQGDKGVLLRDLGSGNGTKVNGEKVAEKVLEHGDEIHIGKTKMKFVDEMAAFKKLRDAEEKKKEEAKEDSAVSEVAEGEEKSGAAAAEGEASEVSEASEGAEAPEGGPKTIARPQLERGDRKPIARRGPEPKGLAGAIEKFKAMEPKKRLLILGGAGVMMVLFFVLIAATRTPPPPAVDPRKAQAAEKMQLARDAVRQEHYEDAIALIESAEKLQPGVDGTKLAAQSRDALAIQRSLEAVRGMIEQNKFDDARTELARIPQGSIKAEEEKAKVTEALKVAEAKFKRGKIDELLAAGEIEAAKQIFAELPDSDQREVAPKFAEAEQQIEDLKKQAELDSRRQAANANASRANKKAENMAIAFAVVQRKFAGNEWQRAGAECDRVIDQNPGDDEIRKRAKQLQQLIPNFGRNYEDGMKKFREGQIASSAKPLRAARGFYQQINLPTPLGAEIDEKLAQAAVMAGKEALLREDLAGAAVNFRDAVKLDPTDSRAKSGLDEVINRAEDLYQSAYMIRDRDPREALKKFKVVVEVTPAGSATHEKAKNQIAAMSP